MLAKTESLLYLEALSKRLPTYLELRKELEAGEKGYEAEVEMYLHLLRKNFPCIILYDVLLKKSGTVQIDFIVITSRKIYLIEVKNLEGIFHHVNDDFFKGSYKMERDPLNRSKNAHNVLDAILRSNHISLPLERKIIFMNPNVTLYGHDKRFPILLKPELEGYLNEMARNAGPLSDYHHRIASVIKKNRPKTNLYKTDYEFDYQMLEKGIWCGGCVIERMEDKHRYLVCIKCGKAEDKLLGVKRSMADFHILFPGSKLTAKLLMDWCGGMIGETTTTQALKHYRKEIHS